VYAKDACVPLAMALKYPAVSVDTTAKVLITYMQRVYAISSASTRIPEIVGRTVLRRVGAGQVAHLSECLVRLVDIYAHLVRGQHRDNDDGGEGRKYWKSTSCFLYVVLEV
jgi:hypothetical protein